MQERPRPAHEREDSFVAGLKSSVRKESASPEPGAEKALPREGASSSSGLKSSSSTSSALSSSRSAASSPTASSSDLSSAPLSPSHTASSWSASTPVKSIAPQAIPNANVSSSLPKSSSDASKTRRSNSAGSHGYLIRQLKAAADSESQNPSEGKPVPRIGLTAMSAGAGIDTMGMAILGALRLLDIRARVFFSKMRYQDSSFYEDLSNEPLYRLDPWLLDRRSMHYLLTKNSERSDVSLLIGEGGLFDSPLAGIARREEGKHIPSLASHDHTARWTETPQLLVLDCRNFDVTQLAQIQGVLDYGQPTMIRGFLLNRIDQEHYVQLKAKLEQTFELPVLGFLPDRHLFQKPARSSTNYRDELFAVASESIDLQAILQIARSAPALTRVLPNKLLRAQRKIFQNPHNFRIGIPLDPIFYDATRDNLDLLREMGVTLVPVSLQRDRMLPEDLDGFYMSGGRIRHPQDLSGNYELREAFRRNVDAGMKVLAEGVGYFYLTRGVYDSLGEFAPMSAVWDVTLHEPRVKNSPALRYGTLQSDRSCLLGGPRLKLQAAMLEAPLMTRNDDLLFASTSHEYWRHGVGNRKLFASPARFHFISHPEALVAFLDALAEDVGTRYGPSSSSSYTPTKPRSRSRYRPETSTRNQTSRNQTSRKPRRQSPQSPQEAQSSQSPQEAQPPQAPQKPRRHDGFSIYPGVDPKA